MKSIGTQLGRPAAFSAIAALCAWGFYLLWTMHLPPLLSNVRAGGLWSGTCPPRSDEPLSPELNERLRTQFPPGTPEERLVRTLAEQRFERPVSCSGEPSIRSSKFYQERTAIFAHVRAEVFWRVDQANNLVWTKGFVFYVGL